jgi:ATP-dependent Clp protease ATP-binding subunit ClpC
MELKELYSEDLLAVLQGMEELRMEYPSSVLTLDYIVLSFLTRQRCRAYVTLDGLMRSGDLEDLEHSCRVTLASMSVSSNIYTSSQKKRVEYDGKLLDVLNRANMERGVFNDRYTDTNHILLSLLSGENRIRNLMETKAVNYAVVKEKVIRLHVEDPSYGNRQHDMMTARTQPLPPERIPVSAGGMIRAISPNIIRKKTDAISAWTVNLTEMYMNGKVEGTAGREDETENIIRTLSKRDLRNVILTGPSGCGKTNLVYSVVGRIISGNVPVSMHGTEVLSVDMPSMLSGTQFRGIIEERMKQLVTEVKNSGNPILFFDDIQFAIGERNNNSDIIGMFNMLLSDRSLRIIATSTDRDYKSHISIYPALVRKMERIHIGPMDFNQSVNVLKHNWKYYGDFHGMSISEKVMEDAVKLSERYMSSLALPASAISLIDAAGAQNAVRKGSDSRIMELSGKLKELEAEKKAAFNSEKYNEADSISWQESEIRKKIEDARQSKNSGEKHDLTVDDLLACLSRMTHCPLESLDADGLKSLAGINAEIKKHVFGQDEAVDSVCSAIKRNRLGLREGRKPPVFLLCGMSGCGKTMLARQLALRVYGSEKKMIRLDMSEYSEKHSVSKLTGAPAGYIGYGDAGKLLGYVSSNRHCVVLLDEMEKACSEVFNVFLPLFDEGYLTDSTGETVDFSDTVIIMTSNTGAKQASQYVPLGFDTGSVDTALKKTDIVRKELKKRFSPEFINRIAEIIYFKPLERPTMERIIRTSLDRCAETLAGKGYSMTYDEKAVECLYGKIKPEDADYGARPVLRIIQEEIETRIADMIIDGEVKQAHAFIVSTNENGGLNVY